MKIMQVAVNVGNGKKYFYCWLESIKDFDENTPMYKSFIDCRAKENSISISNSISDYVGLKGAIKKFKNNFV